MTLIGQGLNLDVLSSLELDIDDLLLPYFFDISIFTQIDNEDLVDQIKRVGQVFYERTTSVEATPAP